MMTRTILKGRYNNNQNHNSINKTQPRRRSRTPERDGTNSNDVNYNTPNTPNDKKHHTNSLLTMIMPNDRRKRFCCIVVIFFVVLVCMLIFQYETIASSIQSNISILSTSSSSKTKELGKQGNVLIVIISNRIGGIIPSIGSVLEYSSKPVDVVIIGNTTINNIVKKHFGSRLSSFTSLTIADITNDLIQNQGIHPVWTWPEWHSSIQTISTNDNGNATENAIIVPNMDWWNENTIHVAEWDYHKKHSLDKNQIRFYVPHLSIFRKNTYVYIMDDDVLVQKDLARVELRTMESLKLNNDNNDTTMNTNISVVSLCNAWIWDTSCQHFQYKMQQDTIFDMPALYGEQPICNNNNDGTTSTDTYCVPSNYKDFLQNILQTNQIPMEIAQQQHGWSFGFTLFVLDHWRQNEMTKKYESIVRENYKLHVYPETSLTFGLGLPYLAFAGAVQCWDDNHMKIRDGFGLIELERMKSTFQQEQQPEQTGNDYHDIFNTADVIHYSGLQKPWEDYCQYDAVVLQPWYDRMTQERMALPKQLPKEPTQNLFLVVGGIRSGAQWLMSILDTDPYICSSGEYDNGEAGYPSDSLEPNDMTWYPTCSVKRGCSYSFVRDSILELSDNGTSTTSDRCQSDYDATSDLLRYHLKRLCNFMTVLNGNFTISSITKVWVDAYRKEDKNLLGCGCKRGVQAKGLKVLSDWIHYKNYPYEYTMDAALNLNDTAFDSNHNNGQPPIKIIRIRRNNLWARYKSMEIAKHTNIWHITTSDEKKAQLNELQQKYNNTIPIDINDLKWTIKYMEVSDQAGDEWVRDRTGPDDKNILWIDYDICKSNIKQCFESIYQFLGIDISKRPTKMTSTTTKKLQTKRSKPINWYDEHYDADGIDNSFFQYDRTFDFIGNKEEVLQLFMDENWTHFIP